MNMIVNLFVNFSCSTCPSHVRRG